MFARAAVRPRLAAAAPAAVARLRIALRFVLGAMIVACGDHTSPTEERSIATNAADHSLDYPGFAGVSIALGGSAAVRSGVLVLTNGGNQIGAAWNPTKQRLSSSWETNFQFRIEDAGCFAKADGFAFVIQNASGTALATGTQGSDLGYTGFRSALAVEFDVFQSQFYPDPNDNHIAINSGGTATVSARQTPIAVASPPVQMKDGNTHAVRIHYERGTLDVYFDTASTPLLSAAVDLTNIGGTNILDANGQAWVGFTGATGGACATQKILTWTLVDNRPPVANAGGTVGPDGVATYDAVEGTQLTLTASATDPEGDAIASYEWDFDGDGHADLVSANPTATHTFASCGTVPVSVVAVDALGARSTPATAQVNVANVNPTVAPLQSFQTLPGQAINLSASFSDPGADAAWAYHIDWGDGTPATDGTTNDASSPIAASHAYAQPRVDPYVITVTVTDKCGGAGSAQTNVKTGRVPATVQIQHATQVYDGSPHPVTVVTDPAELSVDVTYDGQPTPPTNAGTYAVVASISDPRYVGSSNGTLTIQKATAGIQLGGLSGQLYDGTPKAATASTTPTGLHVILMYDATTAAPVDAGSYGVAAGVDDPNYQGSASGTLIVSKAHATLALDQLEYAFDGAPHGAHAATNPAGLTTVTLFYDGSATPPVNAGTYAVAATLANRNYDAVPATAALVIHKAAQGIVFAPIGSHVFGDPPIALAARGGSASSPVTFSLAPASSGCTLSGNVVTIVGATAAGQACAVMAHQAGDANYLPAADVAQSFTIDRAMPRIAWSPADLEFGSPLGAAQLDATAAGVSGAPLAGSFIYLPPAGTRLEGGVQTLSTSFAPADASNYKSASATAAVRVRYFSDRGHRFLPPVGMRWPYYLPRLDVAFQIFRADRYTPVTSAHARLVVQRVLDDGSLGPSVPLPNGAAFKYEWRERAYACTLNTRALDAGTYRLRALLDDGSDIVGEIVIRHYRDDRHDGDRRDRDRHDDRRGDGNGNH